MTSPKEIKSTDSNEVNELVSKAFGYIEPHSFFDDFPIWVTPLSEIVRLGIKVEHKLVSHVGIRFCDMQIEGSLMPVALIGAVATDEKYRGKGLSTSLLNEALALIDKRGCEWSLLWGSEHNFYARLGFKLEGQQTRVSIAHLPGNLKNKFNFIPSAGEFAKISVGFTEAIFNYLVQEKSGIKIYLKDRPWIFAHKTIQWLSINDPFSFIAFERGMDLKHIVHEFGGNISGVHRLLSMIQSQDPAAQVMGKKDAALSLGFKESDLILEYLCLARPKNSSIQWNPAIWVGGISAV